jgi:outer membrane protein TolC
LKTIEFMTFPKGTFRKGLVKFLPSAQGSQITSKAQDKPILLVMLTMILLSGTAQGEEISLDNYLAEVRNSHSGLAASQATAEAAAGKEADADLVLTPSLYSTIQTAADAKPNGNPKMQGDKSTMRGLTVGVAKMTDFGLQGKFQWSINRYEIFGTQPQFVPEPEYIEARPQIELSQSLWKNRFGRETTAMQTALRSAAEATRLGEAYKRKMLMLQAEMAYWRLALAREAVLVQRDNVARAERMRQWSASRVGNELADKTDLLQAEAAVAGRKLELQMALDEEQTAIREFNTLRNRSADTVPGHTARISPAAIGNIKTATRTGKRLDVQAAEAASKATAANAVLTADKTAPAVDVFALLALNGRDLKANESASESFQSKHPTTAVGIKLNMPLGGSAAERQRAAANAEQRAAELNAKHATWTDEQEWNNLTKSLDEARKRLDLAVQMEKIQKDKLEHERTRLRNGRTVTFQVLSFEQDYATAQMTKIRATADVLRIAAQLKTFSPDTAEGAGK